MSPNFDYPKENGVSEVFKQHEKSNVIVYQRPADASLTVAYWICEEILKHPVGSPPCVLGLATGSTPQSVYKQLVRLHKEHDISWKNVVTFNLDEYYPMEKDCLQSYNRFMREHLFDHVDIPKENINIPDGTVGVSEIENFCKNYEQKIKDFGGIDIQLLGIGRTGHIGFNEPGSTESSRTRLVLLDGKTRIDAASDFFDLENVPKEAISMGVGTILEAKRIILLAFNENKSLISSKAIEGKCSKDVTASFLQNHTNATFILDSAASVGLDRIACPWTISGASHEIDWDRPTQIKAVLWLSDKVGFPIRSLTQEEYFVHGLERLLRLYPSADALNETIYAHIDGLISNFPCGVPTELANTPIAGRGPLNAVDRKRVVIFSPHPDDDVISMGGTLLRLCEQGHEVHVAYETTGNIAVWDYEAERFAFFVKEYMKMSGLPAEDTIKLHEKITESITAKKPGEVDSDMVKEVKGLIRKSEARSAAMFCGVKSDNIHYLNLPFYETGKVVKKPLGQEDIDIVTNYLDKIKPDVIFAAGDLSDPHGTHRVALEAVEGAMQKINKCDGPKCWLSDTDFYLYRGAWQEWGLEEASLVIPMNSKDVKNKRIAIFRHQSQKDEAPFPGNDSREFWVRAEARNKNTADMMTKFGFPAISAAEVFVKSSTFSPSR